MNAETIRAAAGPPVLLAACRAAGMEDVLEQSADIWLPLDRLSAGALGVWFDLCDAQGRVTLGEVLDDVVLWALFARKRSGREMGALLDGVRRALADECARRAPKTRPAVALTPPPPRSPKKAPPAPPERPPGAVLWPGMPKDELEAWARENNVLGALAYGVDRIPGTHSLIGMTWFFSRNPRATLGETLTRPPSTGPTQLKAGAPALTLGEHLVAWLVGLAETVRETLRLDAARRAAHVAPKDPTLLPVWTRLLAERDALRSVVTPTREDPRAAVSLEEDPPALVVRRGPVEGCSGAWDYPHVRVSVVADADRPPLTCNCPGDRRARCSVGIQALDIALSVLSGKSAAIDAPRIARAIATPAWSRTFADLDGLLPHLDTTQVDEGPAEIGWGVEVVYGGPRIWPLRCTPKKRGDGWKVAKATDEEVLASEGATAHLDRLLVDALPPRHIGDQGPRVARLLERLAGHPRVFWEGKGTQQAQVRSGALGFRLVAGEDGGARLVTTVGAEAFEPRALVEEGELHRAGDRLVRWEPHRGVLTVIHAPKEAHTVVNALLRRGNTFPPEAVAGLVDRIPTLSRAGPVQAGELVRRVPAAIDPVVRLEVLPDDTLRLEARVRPLAGAPEQVPGEPPVELFARTPDGVVSTSRDAAAEVAAVQGRLAALPLGPMLAEEPFTWLVSEPEHALDVLAALQEATDLDVRWSGKPRRVSTQGKADGLRISVGSAQEWFQVGGELRVGDVALPLARLLEALAGRRPFVKVDEQTWVRLDKRFRERAEALADAAQGGVLAPVNAPLLLALEELGAQVEAPKRWAELLTRIRAAAGYRPDPPAELRAELRPYQKEGFAWLARLATWAEGAVLADDMGLGKTVQTLALLLHRRDDGPALVVAPTSVGFNWVRQAERFAPTLRVRLARGADRPRADAPPGPGDVWVTSYDLLVRDVELLSQLRFATLVLDEAQAVKNADTHRARAARALQADFRVALSGTPLENRTGELWSLFATVAPGVLGKREAFRATYALPIERDGDVARRGALARRIRPFVLRRLKSEVAQDLPPRTEVRVDVDLSPEERGLYEAGRLVALNELAGLAGPDQQQRIQVLAALTRLRQLACHPRLVDPEASPSSAKLDRLVELLRELREEGRRALVFSQFVKQLHLVRERLLGEGFRLRYLDGSTPEEARRAEVDAFQRGEGDAFLVSLKAGGTGLDLTAASDVVILDPWWNPAVEDQAADRAHRIGQTRAVTIYRLVARETVEERILALHAQKRDLVSAVLEGTAAAATLSTADLLALLAGDAPVPEDDEAPVAPAMHQGPPVLRLLEGGAAETQAAPTQAAPTSPEAAIARLLSRLAEAVAREEIAESSSRTYQTLGRRFLTWVAAQGGDGTDAAAIDGWGERYRAGIVRREIDAPAGDAKMLGAVLKQLRG